MLCKLSIKKRTIVLCGDINEEMYSFFESAISELESKASTDIRICMNSEGGNIADALAIAGRIKASECKFNIEIYGSCMSAALAILGVCAHRSASRYAVIMHHESSNSLLDATISQASDQIRGQKIQDKMFCVLLAEHSSKSANWWDKICRRRDVYLTPEQCLKIKLIDKII